MRRILKIVKTKDGRNIMYGVNLDINNGIAVDQGATSKRAAVLAAMPYRKTLAQPKAEVNQNSGAKQHQDRSTIPVTNRIDMHNRKLLELEATPVLQKMQDSALCCKKSKECRIST